MFWGLVHKAVPKIIKKIGSRSILIGKGIEIKFVG